MSIKKDDIQRKLNINLILNIIALFIPLTLVNGYSQSIIELILVNDNYSLMGYFAVFFFWLEAKNSTTGASIMKNYNAAFGISVFYFVML
ncbi:MAG: hypothetical protein INQ03_16940 [Candidatus Heimdallarchaeota archaeon]|nr:hypothetical protein [Candidatus Heimdallarchaeota archaeon]